VVGRISFALERFDSPRHCSHVAQLFSLGGIERMTDALLFPALIGALICVVLCGYRRSRKRRPSLWFPFAVAGLAGVGFTFLAFGLSLFSAGLWTDNGVTSPAFMLVVLVFGMFAAASFVPAFLIVILYRAMSGYSHDAA
jgi:hypothetical protein